MIKIDSIIIDYMYTRNRQYIVPRNISREFFKDAMDMAFYIKVDQLDCSVSIARQPTDKSVDWVVDTIVSDPTSHLTCIERQPMFYDSEPYFDIGGSTMCKRPEYFLWIMVRVPNAEKLIEKYKLKER
jgi:hypothetical protein